MYQLEELAFLLRLTKTRAGFVGACPACGYPTGFSLNERAGKLLAYCHVSQCSWDSIHPYLNQYGSSLNLYPSPAKVAKPAKAAFRADGACYSRGDSCYSQLDSFPHLKLWNQSFTAQKSLVAHYLESRGITVAIPKTVRFLPQAYHKASGQHFPAMLAKVQMAGSDTSVGVHRTFLQADGSGKADVEPNKQSLGSISGASVHLAEPSDTLAVTEGIETGLSVQQVTGLPTWAALNCHGLKTLVVHPPVKTILIFADNDSPNYSSNTGLRAAHFAAERWTLQGFAVKVVASFEPGKDFNDHLREGTFYV